MQSPCNSTCSYRRCLKKTLLIMHELVACHPNNNVLFPSNFSEISNDNPSSFYGSDIHLQRRWRPTIVCQNKKNKNKKNISTLKESHSITTGQTKPGLATLQPATACRHGNVNRINQKHGCKLAQLYTKHFEGKWTNKYCNLMVNICIYHGVAMV